jgi:hypothetical protein
MTTETIHFLAAVVIGLAATLFMDLWALFLNRAFSIPSGNYCLVGRWISHMPEGKFMHANIATASQKRSECAIGWIAHYVIGIVYALALVALVSTNWLARPSLLPAILFGIVSVLVPFLVMQPSFGLGIAASKTPDPTKARLRSLMAHAVFGFGLYLGAVGTSHVLRAHV